MNAASITLPAPRSILDIREFLGILGPVCSSSFWDILTFEDEGWAIGPTADRFDRALDSNGRLSPAVFAELCGGLSQVVWGEFRAYHRENDLSPYLAFVAVDSNFADVWSADPRVIELIRPHYEIGAPRLDAQFYGELVK